MGHDSKDKRTVGLPLFTALLAVSTLVTAPAFAQDAQTDQLQRQINSLQKQLQTLQNQVSETKQQAQAAQQSAQSAQQAVQKVPSGVYDAAQPGAPIPAKGAPSWWSGVKISLAGSFIDVDGVWRQRNEIASASGDQAFGALPFQNSPLYHEDELRGTAQQSRIALKATGDIDPTQHLTGYYEMDFNGAATTANSRNTNSYTPRIRQAFVSYDSDAWHFHFTAGQAYTLATQNRVGIAPLTENTPLVIDSSQAVGFDYLRQPQIRAVWDWNKVAWFGVSVESPQTVFPSNSAGAAVAATYPGPGATAATQGNTVAGSVIPTGFTVNPGNTCNNSGSLDNQTLCSNNIMPDIIEKFALDPGWGHYEVFGLQRWFTDEVAPTGGNWSQKTTFGWGVGGSVLLPAVPKFLDLQGSVLTGRGISRYGSSQLSDVDIGPQGQLVPLQATHVFLGAVAHVWEGLDVYAYAGEEQVKANSWTIGLLQGGYGNPGFFDGGCALENTASTTAATFNPNSSSTCAASLNVQQTQEITVGFWQNLYKGDAGRFALGVQYEYLTLKAFAGTPVAGTGTAGHNGPTPNQGLNPNDNVVFVSLRYYPF
jgi:cell division septum initiation protein DivIVA